MAFGDYLPRKRRGFGELTPLGSVSRLGKVFEDMFTELFESLPIEPNTAGFSPRINMSETDREYRIVAELPGIDEKDIDVSLSAEGIFIRGEKKEEQSAGENFYECRYGSFERFIPIPGEIKAEEIKADFDRGVLTVTLPKSEDHRSRVRKVPIQSGGRIKSGIEVEKTPDASEDRTQSQSTHKTENKGSPVNVSK
jgi:HSP20 family protein